MSEMVIVYEAATDIANGVLDALRRQGLHPSKVESTGPDEYSVAGLKEPHYRRGQWRDLIHITVPSEEAGRARSFLSNWDQQSQTTAGSLIDSLKGSFLIATVLTILLGCILVLLHVSMGYIVPAVPVFWFAVFILTANLGKLTKRLNGERGGSPPGGSGRE